MNKVISSSCTNTIWLEKLNMRVPCGKCMACRVRRTQQWCMRVEHDLYTKDFKGMFITLTFSDEGFQKLKEENPDRVDNSVYKSDLQKYFKRLRKEIAPRKIKYIACGEYGEEKNRAHYHAIILGLDYTDIMDHQRVHDNWSYGGANVGTANAYSIRYVIDYIQKTYIGRNRELTEKYYYPRNPPFQLQSTKIGVEYFMENIDTLISTGKILHRGKEMAMPRYYYEKCKNQIPPYVKMMNNVESMQKIKKKHDIKSGWMNKYHSGINSALQYPVVKDANKQRNKNNEAVKKIKKDLTKSIF